jgi:hypothetical protein
VIAVINSAEETFSKISNGLALRVMNKGQFPDDLPIWHQYQGTKTPPPMLTRVTYIRAQEISVTFGKSI